MKALSNSTTKDCEYSTDNGDGNSIEMKSLNSKYESSINSSDESRSLESSLDDMGLNAEQPDSLLNNHEGESTSLPSECVSEASYSSQDSGIGATVPGDLQLLLKRQSLTVDELLQSVPPFAVEWKSVRDVFQCLTCAAPIDFLSRKVRGRTSKYSCWLRAVPLFP